VAGPTRPTGLPFRFSSLESGKRCLWTWCDSKTQSGGFYSFLPSISSPDHMWPLPCATMRWACTWPRLTLSSSNQTNQLVNLYSVACLKSRETYIYMLHFLLRHVSFFRYPFFVVTWGGKRKKKYIYTVHIIILEDVKIHLLYMDPPRGFYICILK
jgi:hypothetical protein